MTTFAAFLTTLFLTMAALLSSVALILEEIDAQTVPLPKFVPKPPKSTEPVSDEFAMMVQLQPHEYPSLREDGWYQVLDWQLAISNPSELCPSQNCVFQLEGGQLPGETTPGERTLTGKLKINTGNITKIMDLTANWAAVEERIVSGQTVQVIEGTMGIGVGSAQYSPENQYRINGTLTPYGQDAILALQGSKR
ncbi:MAG: hypothetical protein ACR2IS_02190 [Nitrososphaeraceae archaeon]